MNTDDIEKKIIQSIASLAEDVDVSTVNRSSEIEALGLDSMDRVQLLFEAEETFGVNFDNVDAKDFRCVGDIVDYISKNQPSPSS